MDSTDGPVATLLKHLARDLEPTGLTLDAGIFDLAHRRWLVSTDADVLPGFGDEGHVIVLPGRQQILPDLSDNSPDLVEIVAAVREWAVDELGHGWPELMDDDGRFIALLTPVRDLRGIVWSADGEEPTPVGELGSRRIALPPKWDGSRP